MYKIQSSYTDRCASKCVVSSYPRRLYEKYATFRVFVDPFAIPRCSNRSSKIKAAPFGIARVHVSGTGTGSLLLSLPLPLVLVPSLGVRVSVVFSIVFATVFAAVAFTAAVFNVSAVHVDSTAATVPAATPSTRVIGEVFACWYISSSSTRFGLRRWFVRRCEPRAHSVGPICSVMSSSATSTLSALAGVCSGDSWGLSVCQCWEGLLFYVGEGMWGGGGEET